MKLVNRISNGEVLDDILVKEIEDLRKRTVAVIMDRYSDGQEEEYLDLVESNYLFNKEKLAHLSEIKQAVENGDESAKTKFAWFMLSGQGGTDTDKEKAVELGAEAMFIERYPDIVTVYSIGDVSKEICMGPHVKNTKEVGHFKIIKEEASSAGVRRIKAVIE